MPGILECQIDVPDRHRRIDHDLWSREQAEVRRARRMHGDEITAATENTATYETSRHVAGFSVGFTDRGGAPGPNAQTRQRKSE